MLTLLGKDLKMSFIITLHKEKINILEMKEKDGSENRNQNYRRESKRNLGTEKIQ